MAAHRSPVWFALLLSFGCTEYSHTTRIVDGRQVSGRPISAEAYAAYLEGAALEARGEPARAVASYLVALDADPESVAVRTALAHALCPSDPQEAEEHFEAALRIDPYYEPAQRESARCSLSKGDDDRALAHAERALVAAPYEYSSTSVLIDVLVAIGRRDEARRVLWGFLALVPNSKQARARLAQLSPELRQVDPDPDLEIAEALRDGDDRRAVDLALAQRLGRVELARRALEQARPDLALEQSLLVLRADPSNSDARILALVAAFVLEDGRAYRTSLHDGWHAQTLPSDRVGASLAKLLEARAGKLAARAFLEGLARRRAVVAAAPAPAATALPHEVWEQKRAESGKGNAPKDVETAEPDPTTAPATP